MSYNYSNGDGYAVLLPAEPADVDAVADLGPAVRQIKAFLNDPQSTFGGKYCFKATIPGTQVVTVNGVSVQVAFATEVFDLVGNYAANIFTAPVAGVYLFDVFLYIVNGTAVAADVNGQLSLRKNGSGVIELGDISGITNQLNDTFTLKLTTRVLLAAADTIQVVVSGQDGVGTGNFVINAGRFEGQLITRA